MPEYAYPSGVRIPDGDVSGWLIGLHIVFIALLVGSLGVFVWRCFRKPSLWDVPAWIALAAITLGLWEWTSRNFVDRPPQFGFYVALMVLFAFGVINVTICRYIGKPDMILAFLFVECLGIGFFAVMPALLEAKKAPKRSSCKNHLKQFGLALHNYHDAYGSFPASQNSGPQSDFPHSWRVILLSYYDASPVDTRYSFDEPWNSPENIQFQKWYHHLYHCPSHPGDKRFTSYAMLTGPGTMGGDGTKATSIKDITDGTSNTLMVVEACGREIIWTEPKDVEVTEESLGINLPGDQPGRSRGILSSHHDGGAHGLLADGSVRFFAETMDRSVLKALTTIAGDENVRGGDF